MSERKTIVHYGPEPGPKNSLFTALIEFADGDIGAEFTYRADLNNPSHMREKLSINLCINPTYGLHPVVPKDLQEFHRVQTKIYHYALASIQEDKLKLGKNLDTPLTPHPDVEMNLPTLRAIATPEI